MLPKRIHARPHYLFAFGVTLAFIVVFALLMWTALLALPQSAGGAAPHRKPTTRIERVKVRSTKHHAVTVTR